jgi:hypothetical protein
MHIITDIPEYVRRSVSSHIVTLSSQDPEIRGTKSTSNIDRVSDDALFDLISNRGDRHTTEDDCYIHDHAYSPTLIIKLLPWLAELFPKASITASGQFLYPVNGFMGWHTNSDTPHTRMYITYADEGNKSFFRYKDFNDNIITTWDNEGITIRVFDTHPTPQPFWHCVYSECNRYSFGFKMINNLK